MFEKVINYHSVSFHHILAVFLAVNQAIIPEMDASLLSFFL